LRRIARRLSAAVVGAASSSFAAGPCRAGGSQGYHRVPRAAPAEELISPNAKPPFAGPEAVIAYLACYAHRVSISNSRLVAPDERGVTEI
jgi:hypothetical protein